jgi:deoxyribonuclease-4
MILLETTAGSGSWVGYSFGQIKSIVEKLDNAKGIGVCFDTAHVFEAGYDIKTEEGLEKTLKEFDGLLGLDLVKVVHFNDSLSGLGSRVDRHQHIGRGKIGLEAMGRILNHPRLKNAAFIMETPKKSDKDDVKNMRVAKELVKGKG